MLRKKRKRTEIQQNAKRQLLVQLIGHGVCEMKNNVNNGIRLLSKQFFLLPLKKRHSLFPLFIRQKKNTVVSLLCLSLTDKPQRSSLQSVRNNGASNYQTERASVRVRYRNAGTMKCKTIKNTEEAQIDTDTDTELQVEE